jgi:hypothetical protein
MFHIPAHKQSAALVAERTSAVTRPAVTRGTIFELLGDDRIEFGEDQGDHNYIRDETGFAIRASGHYTVEELETLVRALKEANAHFVPKDCMRGAFKDVPVGHLFRFNPCVAFDREKVYVKLSARTYRQFKATGQHYEVGSVNANVLAGPESAYWTLRNQNIPLVR